MPAPFIFQFPQVAGVEGLNDLVIAGNVYVTRDGVAVSSLRVATFLRHRYELLSLSARARRQLKSLIENALHFELQTRVAQAHWLTVELKSVRNLIPFYFGRGQVENVPLPLKGQPRRKHLHALSLNYNDSGAVDSFLGVSNEVPTGGLPEAFPLHLVEWRYRGLNPWNSKTVYDLALSSYELDSWVFRSPSALREFSLRRLHRQTKDWLQALPRFDSRSWDAWIAAADFPDENGAFLVEAREWVGKLNSNPELLFSTTTSAWMSRLFHVNDLVQSSIINFQGRVRRLQKIKCAAGFVAAAAALSAYRFAAAFPW